MRFKLMHLLLSLTCCAAPPGHAQPLVAPESALQAALLYNFALYTEWPGLPAEKIEFCVMASQPVWEALGQLHHKKIKGRALELKVITTPAQAASCQVLFIGPSEQRKIRTFSQLTAAAPLLLVAEEDDFDLRDVVIALHKQDGRYSFKINQTAAQARSLNFSARLLKLATLVY
jgi:hypothetical protein